ncbi:MAG: polysaccharide biosynthesis/export family protein [Bacteroidetes bacterium]|nr:MAG: periplasmic protein involved in polysaccharide export [Bacteroidetes bacterium OLB10]MBX3105249.1 polysaccharide biosynthesis/export family protein [Bacteroidota bacterium]MCB8930122.1 polysaccharide biosynthesis/export family protein [Bacteroidia bacterium]MCB0850521.1 polysaccharide biosynthesis/export family protein [Bacteroidota bacterium]MCO5288600.1 polysaccharide biosynthesis/export family protein [Bacteroidota bacterium]
MKFQAKGRLIPLIIILFLISSCIPSKEYYYFQRDVTNIDSSITFKTYTHHIATNDILSIIVTSVSPEASSYFNPPLVKDNTTDNENQKVIQGYLVDDNGDISIPFLGKLHVKGLTLSETQDLLKKELEKYLISPSVQVRLNNFKIIILGEVNKPGVYYLSNENVSITEALAMAGDMTVFGKRTNILVVRESETGKPQYQMLDITNPQIFSSSYYFLHPNDIIYINARKTKISSGDMFFRITPIIVSVGTFLTLILIRTKIF